MGGVRPKKHLGQHFLTSQEVAARIAGALTGHGAYPGVLEIGPGTGVLTQYLKEQATQLFAIDVDTESIAYLKAHYPWEAGHLIEGDFLKIDRAALPQAPFAIIGNFPYNISSQIFFRVLELRQEVPEVVCMLQKEVARRLCAPPGNKEYGILSVLLQAYYKVEYLFTVKPGVFLPPPKVQSGVIRLQRNDRQTLGCNEALFFKLVKRGFQNRRKTLRNALKEVTLPEAVRTSELLSLRAEALSVQQFVELCKAIESGGD